MKHLERYLLDGKMREVQEQLDKKSSGNGIARQEGREHSKKRKIPLPNGMKIARV